MVITGEKRLDFCFIFLNMKSQIQASRFEINWSTGES